MKTYVALLHSIILGAGRRVVMSELRSTVESIGFRSPRTLVATGNLVFDADNEAVAEVEAALEAAFARDFGKHVDIIARSADEWLALAAGNPFSDAGEADAANIVVRVMRKPLGEDVLPSLERHCGDGERIWIVRGDLWVHFPGKPSTSKLLPALTTTRLGIGTLRNWNTVRGLGKMIES